MKNIIAINGSPRKNGNTAQLLKSAIDGFCENESAHGEVINLYDLDFKGCTSCFACKLKGGKNYGKCAYKDELTPVLGKIEHADALILGSPVYLGNVTGEMRGFLERLTFQYLVYDKNHSSLNTHKIPTAFIYTMNVNEYQMQEFGYPSTFALVERFIKNTFGECESLCVTDTKQFDDYSKYVCEMFDLEHKTKRHEEQFPIDLERAYELGKTFASR